MQTNLQNDRPSVTSAGPVEIVRKPCGIFTGFNLAEDRQKNNRRSEALAAAYRYILGPEWGKP